MTMFKATLPALLAAVLLSGPAAAEVHTTFTATDADFPNPERGFYRPADTGPLTPAFVAETYADGYRLIYARLDLEPWRETNIPADWIAQLEQSFAAARQGGVKLILRATYNYPRGETGYLDAQDASLTRVEAHLKQLTPVLHRNADVIAFMQAGFIGAWGEWHTSSHGLTAPESRNRVRDALLVAVPETRFIQFRYPPHLQDWTPDLSRAGKGFRLGFHNDCFLASKTDVGTWDEAPDRRAQQQHYIDALGDIAPFGGETCNPADEAGATPRTRCADILGEGARYNLTYLNDSYYRRLFHDNWRKQGCMAEVRRNIGYRLSLLSAAHPDVVQRGNRLSLNIVIRNSGWARLYNPRATEIVLRDPVSGDIRRLSAHGADPSEWKPGTDTAVTLTVSVPEDLPPGSREVWLALPDPDSRLRADARFAIRLANADDRTKDQAWDDQSGAFALGTRLEIR